MRRSIRLTLLAASFSALAAAETWTGTLVDVMCKDKDLANHPRQCAINCAKSGYGLMLSGGKFLKFDEAGNSKALAALKASTKDKDLKAKVSGELEGEMVKVASVEIE